MKKLPSPHATKICDGRIWGKPKLSAEWFREAARQNAVV
jgi:hypothetical protein